MNIEIVAFVFICGVFLKIVLQFIVCTHIHPYKFKMVILLIIHLKIIVFLALRFKFKLCLNMINNENVINEWDIVKCNSMLFESNFQSKTRKKFHSNQKK